MIEISLSRFVKDAETITHYISNELNDFGLSVEVDKYG
jgi:hypothetical protein